MRNIRFFCAALALSLVLAPLSPSARAVEAQPLLPSVREYAGAFSDVTGSWCERYVETVYEAGLMDGTSAERFDPDSSLTYAQITAITARALQPSRRRGRRLSAARGWGGLVSALRGVFVGDL